MSTEIQTLKEEISSLKKELRIIKKNMVEKDEIMNLNEFSAYKKSFNKKNLVSLVEAEKKLGF